jgi:hypothetical protein
MACQAVTRLPVLVIIPLCALGALASPGCSYSPQRIAPPSIDPNAAGAAITAFDNNGDGELEESELAKCPPLRAALPRIDTNGDRRISRDELDKRLVAWQNSRVGLMPVTLRIKLAGKPLTDAEVRLVPEEFLGPNVKPAVGTTNKHGVAVMQISNEPDERGVQSGFYRIEISKPSSPGSVPARYNTETQIGMEVEPNSPESRDANFDLAP